VAILLAPRVHPDSGVIHQRTTGKPQSPIALTEGTGSEGSAEAILRRQGSRGKRRRTG
jgi:hypothetical protein